MLTPDSAVLLALIGALLLTVIWCLHRLTNSRGTMTWELRTTQPDPGSAVVEEAKRRVAEMGEARRILDEREAELTKLEKKHGTKTMGDPD